MLGSTVDTLTETHFDVRMSWLELSEYLRRCDVGL